MNSYIIKESTKDEAELIIEKLVEYNLSKVRSNQKETFLNINRVIEDSKGKIIAGINSRMYCWKCLYIDSFWVDSEYRKQGLGTMIINEVENIAKNKGCKLIHLDTFDFQAKDFYLKKGYEIFGVLEECPENHKRYYMKKVLEQKN